VGISRSLTRLVRAQSGDSHHPERDATAPKFYTLPQRVLDKPTWHTPQQLFVRLPDSRRRTANLQSLKRKETFMRLPIVRSAEASEEPAGADAIGSSLNSGVKTVV